MTKKDKSIEPINSINSIMPNIKIPEGDTRKKVEKKIKEVKEKKVKEIKEEKQVKKEKVVKEKKDKVTKNDSEDLTPVNVLPLSETEKEEVKENPNVVLKDTDIDNNEIDSNDIDNNNENQYDKKQKEKKEKIPKEKKEKKEKEPKIKKSDKKNEISESKSQTQLSLSIIPSENESTITDTTQPTTNDESIQPIEAEKPLPKKRGRRPNLKPDGTPVKQPPVPGEQVTKKKGKNPKESYGLNENFEEDDPFFNQQEPEQPCVEIPIIRLNVTAADIRKIKDPNFNPEEGDTDLNIPSAYTGNDGFSYFQSNNNANAKEIPQSITNNDIQQLRVNRDKELENAETSSNDSKLLCQYIEHNKKGTWPEKSNYDCMWCRYPFDNTPWAIPYRLTYDNKFEVFGNFCSPNCAAAYIFDRFDDDDMWDRYALLNMLYQKVYDQPGAIVKSAPDVLFLKKLGGVLTIEEYREISSNVNKNYYIKMPPMVSIIPSVEELQQTSLFNENPNREHLNKELMMKANEELRLRRTKPIYDDTNTLDNYFHIS